MHTWNQHGPCSILAIITPYKNLTRCGSMHVLLLILLLSSTFLILDEHIKIKGQTASCSEIVMMIVQYVAVVKDIMILFWCFCYWFLSLFYVIHCVVLWYLIHEFVFLHTLALYNYSIFRDRVSNIDKHFVFEIFDYF